MTAVVLIGYRGTGKTTVGRCLARLTGLPFADADAEIEARAGMTIADIFRAEGEPGFRTREAEILAEIVGRGPAVIATGGGVILRPANRELIRAAGFVAWLTAPPDVLWGRIQADAATPGRRPNLTPVGGRDEVRAVMIARENLYRETATAAFDVADLSPDAVAAAILSAWTNGGSISRPPSAPPGSSPSASASAAS